MPAELSLAVVGAEHPNKDGGNRRSEIIFCDRGEPVELVPEPKNKVDPQAVMVLSARGFQIGYLTAERAPWIGAKIRAGEPVTAIFDRSTRFGAWIRARFDGGRPTLPEIKDVDEVRPEQAEQDFYPDPDPPDEFL